MSSLYNETFLSNPEIYTKFVKVPGNIVAVKSGNYSHGICVKIMGKYGGKRKQDNIELGRFELFPVPFCCGTLLLCDVKNYKFTGSKLHGKHLLDIVTRFAEAAGYSNIEVIIPRHPLNKDKPTSTEKFFVKNGFVLLDNTGYKNLRSGNHLMYYHKRITPLSQYNGYISIINTSNHFAELEQEKTSD